MLHSQYQRVDFVIFIFYLMKQSLRTGLVADSLRVFTLNTVFARLSSWSFSWTSQWWEDLSWHQHFTVA